MRFAICFKKKPPKYRIVEVSSTLKYYRFAVQKVDDAGNWTFVSSRDLSIKEANEFIRQQRNDGKFIRVVKTYP